MAASYRDALALEMRAGNGFSASHITLIKAASMVLINTSQPPEGEAVVPVSPDTVVKDRRRPGRPSQASPHLILLMRGAADIDVTPPLVTADGFLELPEGLPPFVCVFIIAALSTLLWAGIIEMGRLVLN